MNLNSQEYQNLITGLERIYSIKDESLREYEIWKESQRLGMDADTYRRIFRIFSVEQIKRKWLQSPLKAPWIYIEIFLENLHQSLNRMAIFQIFDFVSKLFIIIAIFTFFVETEERIKQRDLEQRRTIYEAWQVINSGIGKPSNGRKEALEFLHNKGQVLAGLNISNAVLEDLQLSGAILKSSDMSYAELSRSEFSDAELVHTDFSNASLWKVNFSGASLSRTNFSQTDFFQANLSKANVLCANFWDAKNLTFDQLNKSANWASALYSPSFQDYLRTKVGKSSALGKRLRPKPARDHNGKIIIDAEAKLVSANLVCEDLTDVNLENVDLSGADLSFAKLSRANLKNANLSGAKLHGAIIDNANLNGAELHDADFRNAKGLSPIQIKLSKTWKEATFDDTINEQL